MDKSLLQRLSGISDEEKAILSGKTLQKDLYMDNHESQAVIDAGHLLENGQLIGIRAHTRFVHFPKHSHNYVEMVYMCSGSTTHIVNGEKIILNEGELLLLGQGATQEIQKAGKTDIALNFIILPQFFDRVLQVMDTELTPLRSFIINSLRGGANTGYLYYRISDFKPVQNLIENLIMSLMYDTFPNRRSVCQTTMGLLFMNLMGKTELLASDGRYSQDVGRTLLYIEEHYKDASLSEIAHFLHHDLYWLSREIKIRTGQTYKQLLQSRRLSMAEYYLRNTDLSVDEIAQDVGYSNISYFHRIFYKKNGMTPRRYRLESQSVL